MKRMAESLAAAAVWLLAAMPVLAQQPAKSLDDLTEEQVDEFYCVYDILESFGDIVALTDAYMSGDTDSAAYQEQFEGIENAVEDCDIDYTWSPARKDTASMIGVYGVMGDELEQRLSAAGLQEKDLDAFYVTVEAMPKDDLSAFAGRTWAGKKDLADRFTAALAAEGIKGDAVLKNAFYLAEAYIIMSILTAEWLDGIPAS